MPNLFAQTAATPEPILTTLRNEVRKALSQKEFADKLNVTGALQPLLDTPEEFSALIRRDYEKYGKLAKEIGVRIE